MIMRFRLLGKSNNVSLIAFNTSLLRDVLFGTLNQVPMFPPSW